MPLEINLDRAPRKPSELEELVRAVLVAHESDEADWIEWKSRVDLTSRKGRFDVARQILGFGNRSPGNAHAMEGHAYLLVGVEPGELHGIESVDPASLDAWLTPYLGQGDSAPRWSVQFVKLHSKVVLVLIVDPPKWGDPIFPLRKSYDTHIEGAIFVRRKGGIQTASADEISTLQQRLLRGSDIIRVALELPRDGLSAARLVLESDDVETWKSKVKQLLLTPAADEHAERVSRAPAPSQEIEKEPKQFKVKYAGLTFGELGELQKKRADGEALTEEEERRLEEAEATLKSLGEAARTVTSSLLARVSEDRSEDEFQAQVDKYLEKLDQAIHLVALRWLVARRTGAVDLTLTNLTSRNFSKTQVELTLPRDCVVLEGPEVDGATLPSPPRPWGKGRRFALYPPSPAEFAGAFNGIPDLIQEVEVVTKKDTIVRFAPVDLRPMQQLMLPIIHVIVPQTMQSKRVDVAWRATSTSADGESKGTFLLGVQSVSIRMRELEEYSKGEADGSHDDED